MYGHSYLCSRARPALRANTVRLTTSGGARDATDRHGAQAGEPPAGRRPAAQPGPPARPRRAARLPRARRAAPGGTRPGRGRAVDPPPLAARLARPAGLRVAD